MRPSRTPRAFTLVELITVMAITAILMTIITIPVVQSFNLTRAAQGFADAQDRARILIDQIVREIGSSAGVRDNTGERGTVVIRVPSDPDGNGVVNSYQEVRLANAKLDIVMPAASPEVRQQGGTYSLLNPNSLIDPNGDPSDPANWRVDPTLKTPTGQAVLPAAQGYRLIRYFIGLRDPLAADGLNPAGYSNPYDQLLTRNAIGKDNLFVLFRAEVDYRIFNRQTGAWTFNSELFVDQDGDGYPDNLDDPRFFIPDGTLAKANQIRAWLRRSRIVTEFSRYDMIQPVYDRKSRRVVYDGQVPRVFPLVQFTPTRVTSEPAEGMLAVRAGEETVNAEKLGPDVFRTKFGGWTSLLVRTWPSVYNGNQPWAVFAPWASGTPYQVGRIRVVGNQIAGFSIYDYDGASSELTGGIETFDASGYAAAKSLDPTAPLPPGRPAVFRYPFSYAVAEANSRSGWLSNPAVRTRFVPYAPESRSGKILASFSISEVGNGSEFVPGDDNRPRMATGRALTPAAASQLGGGDPDGLSGTWSDPAFAPSSPASAINRRFNKLWVDWAGLAPGLDPARYCKRFIDLRVVPNADGEPSPLHPTLGFPRARIVPGSEIVIGPDQTPGPNYGNPTRYTRIAEGEVGPNQYKINYVHQREPDWNLIGFSGVSSDPTVYNASNFVSAILQPQFRAGYLELNSRFGEPLPGTSSAGNILVSYRFQFTESSDVFAVDYDTRQVMEVGLTIRNYPQTTLPNPQTVTVTGSATVRNFLR